MRLNGGGDIITGYSLGLPQTWGGRVPEVAPTTMNSWHVIKTNGVLKTSLAVELTAIDF